MWRSASPPSGWSATTKRPTARRSEGGIGARAAPADIPDSCWPPKGVFMPRFTDAFRVAEESGQTMADYGVVLALVTLAVLAAPTMLGANVSSARPGR